MTPGYFWSQLILGFQDFLQESKGDTHPWREETERHKASE